MRIIVILTALRDERKAVERAAATLAHADRTRVLIIQGGVGLAAAERAAQKALQAHAGKIGFLCSTGFGGGLVEALTVGSVLLVEKVCAGPKTFSAEARACASVAKAFANEKKKAWAHQSGLLATVSNPVFSTQDKQHLHKDNGALVVDMESAAVARAAQSAGLPYFGLRAISDSVTDELPKEVGEFLDESGGVRLGPITKFALGGPSRIRELTRLGKRAKMASKSLEAAWKLALPELLAR